MSTKTIKQRIAVVAVSALTAGLFSVVSAPVANAAPTDDLFYFGTTNAVAAVLSDSDEAALRSVGVLASSTTGNGTTMTATILSNGSLAVLSGGAADTSNVSSIIVTGGTISSFDEESISANVTSSLNTSRNVLVASAANKNLSAAISPNSGVTSMVIEFYNGDNISSTLPTTGTLRGRITVTVAATSVAGVLSLADSTVYWATDANASDSATTNADSANYSLANGGDSHVTITLNDAYEAAINNASAFVTATVTGNAKVALSTSADPSTASATSVAYQAVSGLTSGKIYAKVSQLVANQPSAFTVTFKYNDTLLATKSGVIAGQVASMKVSSVGIGRTGATSADNFLVTFADSAGNVVVPANQTTAVSVVSSTLTTGVTGASVTTAATASAAGKGSFTCSGTTGAGVTGGASAKLQLQILDATSNYVKSNVFDAVCGGDAAAFTASLDKASYTPGSVATLTFKFTDSKGNTSNDFTSFAASTAATYVGAPGTVVTAAATADKSTAGLKTYQFIVGTTEGDFTMVADAPDVRTANVAAGGSQGKVTIAYTVKSSASTVTNAEVLKSIVSLIASINKQIQALQKLILRR